jgi:hypothetical protein
MIRSWQLRSTDDGTRKRPRPDTLIHQAFSTMAIPATGRPVAGMTVPVAREVPGAPGPII